MSGLRRRLCQLATSFVLVFLLAACVPTSEHPIATKKPTPDPTLLGSWHGTMSDGAATYFHFLKGGDGRVVALLVATGKADADISDAGWAAFHVVSAEIKGQRYLSAQWDYNDGKPVEGRDKGYHLLRYERGPGSGLTLYTVNEDKLIAAVKAGQVKGQIEGEGLGAEVRLTASSRQLERFLRHADPKDLFDQPFATLIRAP